VWLHIDRQGLNAMNKIDLEGQVAVVTGGAQGLGLAFARRMVASGARVSLWDMNKAGLEVAVAGLGDAAKGVLVDITDAEAEPNSGYPFSPQGKDEGDPTLARPVKRSAIPPIRPSPLREGGYPLPAVPF
jgi:hypothetical protein